MGQLFPVADQADQGLTGPIGADIDMAYQSGVAYLVIGGNGVLLHPALDGPAGGVGLGALQQAAWYIDDVMATGTEKPHADSLLAGHRKLGLVAVPVRMGSPVDHIHCQIQPANAPEGVLHPLAFEGELLLIGHMPQGASPALGEVGTVRSDAGRGGGEHLLHLAPGGGFAHLQQFHQAGFSPDGPFHKDCHALQSGDAVSFAGITFDFQGDELIFPGVDHDCFLRAVRIIHIIITESIT